MYILAGSSSVLANHILPGFRDHFQVCAFDRDRGDIQNGDFVADLIDEIKPTVFINCSQMDHLDECEYNRDIAYSVNATAVGNVAKLCRERGILLVHFSSSHVFDGTGNVPFGVEDAPNPISAYGDSKLLGEKLIEESGCDHLIVRVPDVFGRGNSFLHQIISNIRTDRHVKVMRDQIISPTYALDISEALRALLDRGARGIFHFANEGSCRMKEFIRTSVDLFRKHSGKQLDCDIQEMDHDDFLSVVDLCTFNVLDCSRYRETVSQPVRDWKTSLDDFMMNYFTDL